MDYLHWRSAICRDHLAKRARTDMNFDVAFDRIIGAEGGYTSGDGDPGGETKWGISKRSYPTLDIPTLTRDQAKAIWYADFWMKVKFVKHLSVQFQLVDAAYNHGFGNAIRILQRSVDVADDGNWGPLSQSAYDLMEENDILLRFIGYRISFFVKLQSFSKFGRGWMNRMAQNMLYAASDN
jgi:lysozyme family protein